jgi:hypothetical protein
VLYVTGPRRRNPRDGYYYRCPTRHHKGKDACSQECSYRAEETEACVWGFVADLLKDDPKRLHAGRERLIDRERSDGHADCEREAVDGDGNSPNPRVSVRG